MKVLSIWKGEVLTTVQRPTMGQICMDTAIEHGVTIHDLRGESRRREFVVPRQIAIARMYETGRFSMPQIGRFMGGRDHTTVLHSIRAVAKRKQAETQNPGAGTPGLTAQ